MSRDDLRFGDVDAGGSGGGPVDTMEMLIELAVQGLVLLVILYVFLSVLDVLVFNGALPLV